MVQPETNTTDLTTALPRNRCILKRQRWTYVDDGFISYTNCSDGAHHVMGSAAEALTGLPSPRRFVTAFTAGKTATSHNVFNINTTCPQATAAT